MAGTHVWLIWPPTLLNSGHASSAQGKGLVAQMQATPCHLLPMAENSSWPVLPARTCTAFSFWGLCIWKCISTSNLLFCIESPSHGTSNRTCHSSYCRKLTQTVPFINKQQLLSTSLYKTQASFHMLFLWQAFPWIILFHISQLCSPYGIPSSLVHHDAPKGASAILSSQTATPR